VAKKGMAKNRDGQKKVGRKQRWLKNGMAKNRDDKKKMSGKKDDH
jgi:hypothetical protein